MVVEPLIVHRLQQAQRYRDVPHLELSRLGLPPVLRTVEHPPLVFVRQKEYAVVELHGPLAYLQSELPEAVNLVPEFGKGPLRDLGHRVMDGHALEDLQKV